MAQFKDIPSNGVNAGDPTRVMVVDDSAVVRGLVSRILEEDSAVRVIASVSNGEQAIRQLDKSDVEVVVLDIEMPVMDGLTALPKLIERNPALQVIMASTLTKRNAEISLRALESGAADYVPKPTSGREINADGEFRREILSKVKSLGEAYRRHAESRRPAKKPGGTFARRSDPVARGATGATTVTARRRTSAGHSTEFTLRDPSREKPEIVAIGSSTGGPQALFAVLKGLRGGLRLPVVITQHMPATFTTILAEHIQRMTGWEASEASDGDLVVAGKVLLAPGGYHMLVAKKGSQKVARITQTPPENFCRPAVDPLFRSVATVYGPRALAVVLTGMGSDGTEGGKAVIDGGGTVVAQDEATSVVWGMPGAAASAGVCSAVLPVGDLAPHIIRLVNRGPR